MKVCNNAELNFLPYDKFNAKPNNNHNFQFKKKIFNV